MTWEADEENMYTRWTWSAPDKHEDSSCQWSYSAWSENRASIPSSRKPRRAWKAGQELQAASRDSLRRLKRISRKLVGLFRHDNRLAIREDGFSKVNDILARNRMQSLGVELQDILQLVDAQSGKSARRFELCEEDAVYWIRATNSKAVSPY